MTDTKFACSVCRNVFSEHRASVTPVDPEEDQIRCPNCGSARTRPLRPGRTVGGSIRAAEPGGLKSPREGILDAEALAKELRALNTLAQCLREANAGKARVDVAEGPENGVDRFLLSTSEVVRCERQSEPANRETRRR